MFVIQGFVYVYLVNQLVFLDIYIYFSIGEGIWYFWCEMFYYYSNFIFDRFFIYNFSLYLFECWCWVFDKMDFDSIFVIQVCMYSYRLLFCCIVDSYCNMCMLIVIYYLVLFF